MKFYFFLGGCLITSFGFSQIDTIPRVDSNSFELEQVVIAVQRKSTFIQTKSLSSLDEYLEKTESIDMIKRGGYASEAFINGMASERSVTTIDGMRIYAACTDKMDPVTSYVETTNLERADVHHSQSGSAGGSTIAGSLNLIRKKSGFGAKKFGGTLFTGIESVNWQKIAGTSLNYSSPKFYADVDFTLRDAENYKAGRNTAVLYSQFTKLNTAANLGVKLGEQKAIEGVFIYDHAYNVGYPALTMDVAFAKAIIASVAYSQHHVSKKIHGFDVKLYFNDVAHKMDDSKRPFVPIRMDMPGWSRTAGLNASMHGFSAKNKWKFNVSSHVNQSLAEMTMFSNNPSEKDMFMLTWPGVRTSYVDLYAEDEFQFKKGWNISWNGGIAAHFNQIYSRFGLKSLEIFYPQLNPSLLRILPRLATNVQWKNLEWNAIFGVAYGERAPSVSEGYGYYLFNSFDKFDYIGNPEMKNERSYSFNASTGFVRNRFSFKAGATYFYLQQYILGIPDSNLSAMTIGSVGVKVYQQLEFAQLFNAHFSADFRLYKGLKIYSKLNYRRGIGEGGMNLPLIQPFSHTSGILFKFKSFGANIEVQGSIAHTKINAVFGERKLPAFAILNIGLTKDFKIKKQQIQLKSGVENLFDLYYVTFSDWNGIPRPGRNFYLNVVWIF